MKKYFLYISCFCFVLLTACSDKPDSAKRTISVTLEPLRYFTEALAGEHFRVVSLVPKGASAETYDPTPQQLVELGKSEAYLRIGHIGFEQIWMERLQNNAPHMRVFDTSTGVAFIHEEENHDGHRHAHGIEPHIWNSTTNAQIIARNVCRALCTLDSVHAPEYNDRLDSLNRVIVRTDSIIQAKLAQADKAFLIYHPALSYFARDYGLRQIPIEQGGKEPSPAYMKSLIDLCREQNIRIIFVQPEFDVRNAETIAAQTNTIVKPINPLSYHWEEEMISVANALHP